MPRPKQSKRKGRTVTGGGTRNASLATLRKRVARLLAARDAERQRHVRQLAQLRRSRDRRLSSMLREIAQLRHHEARAQALTRLLAERETALAAQAARVAELEARLPLPAEIT
jgi:hypothetical protein